MDFNFAFIIYALAMLMVPSTSRADIEIEDVSVHEHDVSKWNDESNKQIELNEAIVDGLAATTIKRNLPVKPTTSVLKFNFYNFMTEYIRKFVHGLTTVRLASIVLHYKPHTDDCKGSLSYALVDNRFSSDSLEAKKGGKSKGTYKVVGKIKHLVSLRCSEEAIIQMSMNHFVSVNDLKRIQLVQIASGLDMTTGDLATISIGWKTVPGDATVYQHYPAQKYVIPRLNMPELVGKSTDYVYKRIVSMAQARHNREVQMLNKLQTIVDSQANIDNQLAVDYTNDLSKIDMEIKRRQNEIEKIEQIVPNKQLLDEKKKVLNELNKVKDDKLKLLMDGTSSEITVDVNDDGHFSVMPE